MISEVIKTTCFTVRANEVGCKTLEDLNITALEQTVLEHGMVLLKGFNTSDDNQMIDFSKKIGQLLEWDFGYVLDLKINKNPKNHIFSQGKVELHWDGAFAGVVPRFNFFQCLASSADSGGGETTFINTVKFLEDLPKTEHSVYQDKILRYFTEKKAHYGGTIEEKLISTHPQTGKARVRFIEPFNKDNLAINPVKTNVLEITPEKEEVFLHSLIERLYASQHFYSHQWTKGDYLLVDNHAMLHGRHRFQGQGLLRHLKRVHIL